MPSPLIGAKKYVQGYLATPSPWKSKHSQLNRWSKNTSAQLDCAQIDADLDLNWNSVQPVSDDVSQVIKERTLKQAYILCTYVAMLVYFYRRTTVHMKHSICQIMFCFSICTALQ